MSYCDLCRLDVPTRQYSDSSNPPIKKNLCEFCASCKAAANGLWYPEGTTLFYILHAIMYVGHRIIRELRDLRRVLKKSGVITNEEE